MVDDGTYNSIHYGHDKRSTGFEVQPIHEVGYEIYYPESQELLVQMQVGYESEDEMSVTLRISTAKSELEIGDCPISDPE